VGLRAGLDKEARGKILSPLPDIEPRSPGRPAHSQTMCWLSYPAHNYCHNNAAVAQGTKVSLNCSSLDESVMKLSSWQQMHIPIFVAQGWYTKHRGISSGRRRGYGLYRTKPISLSLSKM
jgi:hypothetical protein